MKHSQARLGHEIRARLATILRERVADPRLAGVNIAEVRVAPDASYARVFYATLGDAAEAAAALAKAKPFIRRCLAAELHVRRVPELDFRADDAEQRAGKLDSVLRELERERAGRGEEEPRVIDGFLVIDKPVGLTSHDVVQRVRRWAKQRRVGHLGTLDPLAVGVLPIALGEATKLSQLLTHGEKSYRGKVRLGIETTTYDREGEVVRETAGPWPERAQLEKALAAFRGEIEQVPPPYSAVKQGGQAAYRRARRGEAVVLEPRRVTIKRLELVAYEPPFVTLEVDCSSGTYLRSMAHDLGIALGTGAHLWELCRTQSGPFSLGQAVPLDALDALGQERVIPMIAATGLPTFEIDARVARRVTNGVQLGRGDVKGAPIDGVLQLVHEGRLVALVEAQRGIPELRTLRVFHEGDETRE